MPKTKLQNKQRPKQSAPRKRGPIRSKKRSKQQYRYPNAGANIGSSLGSLYGPVGSMLGRAVGSGAQALVKKVTGWGDYTIKGNSLVTNHDAVPEFSNSPRCTIIAHREYITDIFSGPTLVGASTGFDSRLFQINPARFATFPWLNAIARNFEQYVIQGMIFEFKSNSATAVSSTNTALGTVIMATQYNSLSPPFISKQQMENYEFSQSTVPSQSALHPIECDPSQTQCGGLFNMFDPSASSGDARLYNIGDFSIATQGMQAANVNLGELWVTYKICLLKPKLAADTATFAFFQLQNSSIAPAAPFGAAGTQVADQRNYVNFASISPTAVTISPDFVGNIQITVLYHGGDTTTITGRWTATGPAIRLSSINATQVNSVISTPLVAPTTTNATQTDYFRCAGGQPSVFSLTGFSVAQTVTPISQATVTIVAFASYPFSS